MTNKDYEIVKSWYLKGWISYRCYLELTGLVF